MMTNPVRMMAKGLVLLLSLALILYALRISGAAEAFNKAWVDTHLANRGCFGALLFVLCAALFTSVGVPRQMVGVLGGYAFGFALGTPLALAGTLTSCIATFYYSRFFGRSFVNRKFGKRVAKLNAIISGNTFSTALIIRLLPVGNNLITNLLAGVSNANPAGFFLGSLLGYIPQTVVFTLLGSGVHVSPVWRTVLSLALFLLASLLGWTLYRRRREARILEDEQD